MNTCSICNGNFASGKSLRKHFKLKHTNQEKLKCEMCSYKTKIKFSLKRHIMKVHDESSHTVDVSLGVICPICLYRAKNTSIVEEHFLTAHNIHLKSENFDFNSESEFNKWKVHVEQENYVMFIKNKGDYKRSDGSIVTQFACHRSGIYKSKGRKIRSLKRIGSNKIGGYCPAKMNVVIYSSGQVKAMFCSSHVGHEPDIERMTLTDVQKQEIAEKIALHIPFDKIIDDYRSSVKNSNFGRLNLIKRKDLFNIQKNFYLKSVAVRSKNEKVTCVPLESSSEMCETLNWTICKAETHKQEEIIEELGTPPSPSLSTLTEHQNESAGITETKEKLAAQFHNILEEAETERDMAIISKYLQSMLLAL